MKILFVISHLAPEGPVHALQSIIKGFRLHGDHDISILTLSTPEKDVLHSQFQEMGVRSLNIPVKAASLFLDLRQIRCLLKTERFDIVASSCIRADAMLGMASLGLKSSKIFTTVHNIPAEDLGFLYPGWRGRAAAWLHYQVLRLFGNRIICVSQAIRRDLQNRIGTNGTCVWNPIARAHIVPAQPGPVPLIVYAASLSARKNTPEAISFVVDSLSPGTYIYEVYGKGPLEEELRERYRQQPQILWKGFSNNLAQVFSGASVYVSSSFSEGLPLTPQQALMCGCPCVLSDIPQHRELAAVSDFIFIYRHGDLADFGRALRSALQADRAQVRDDGLRLAEQISPISIATKLHNTYNFI